MTEKLGVFQEHTRPFSYYVAWVLEDGDAGGSFGGTANPDTSFQTTKEEAFKSRNYNDFEDAYLELYARRYAADNSVIAVRKHFGVHFESQSQAKKFLAAMNAARKAIRVEFDGVEWPEWTKAALAAGWKAPKGWKP